MIQFWFAKSHHSVWKLQTRSFDSDTDSSLVNTWSSETYEMLAKLARLDHYIIATKILRIFFVKGEEFIGNLYQSSQNSGLEFRMIAPTSKLEISVFFPRELLHSH